jgi:hypothetical protein
MKNTDFERKEPYVEGTLWRRKVELKEENESIRRRNGTESVGLGIIN